jgi:hypothetical protein
LMCGFLGLITAGVSSLCLYFYAKRRIPPERPGRHRVVVASAIAPFLALLWLVMALLIHVAISNELAHQDCGFSPDPYVTLPNGYVLGSHNTYDGYFRAPGFETDVPVAGPGYVRSIIDLRLSEGYFIGTQFDFKTSSVRHFVFDTRTRAFQTSDTKDSGSRAFQASAKTDVDAWPAAETSAHDDATSYWKLYAQYRRPWPNYILVVLIIAGEGAIVLWVRKLWITV